jgi:methylated-DNA-protein-cysteine methyltransferase-like protein
LRDREKLAEPFDELDRVDEPGRREDWSVDVRVRETDPSPPNAAPWPGDHEPTDFQRDVIKAVRSLIHGELATYGEIAEEVGRPGAGQAVANVLRRATELPWWRVVPADGRLYRSHAPVQAPLLEAEGHHIDNARRIGYG